MPTDKAAAYVIGMGLTQALAHAAPDVPKEKYPELGARYRHHYSRTRTTWGCSTACCRCWMRSRRGHWLAVATGKSRRGLDDVLAHGPLKGVRRLAHRRRNRRQAAPADAAGADAEFGVPAERTLMIGDTTHDLQMALNAGCPSVGVSYGAHEPGEFEALKPLLVAHSVARAHDWLLENA